MRVTHEMVLTPTYRRVFLFDGQGMRLFTVSQERGHPEGPWAFAHIEIEPVAYMNAIVGSLSQATTQAVDIARSWMSCS